MADGVNIATLALQVDDTQGVLALGRFGDASEKAAARSSAASNKIMTDTMRNAQMAAEAGRAQNIALREQAAAAGTLTKGQIALAAAMAEQAAATSASTVALTANAAAQTEVAVASTARAVPGLGRLAYSFGALDARVLGTSSIVGRMGAIFGNLFVGGPWTIAILVGIAAIAGAWMWMSGKFDEGAKAAAESIKKLVDEVKKAKDAMGTLTVGIASTNLADAKVALDAAKARAAARRPGAADPTGMFGAALSAADTGASAADVKTAQAVYDRAVQDSEAKRADAMATLIKGNALAHAERVKAIALLKKDQADEAALLGKSDDASMARRVALSDQIKTLNDALYPKEHAGKKPSFLDPITDGSAILKSVVEHNVTWYKKEVEEADRAIAARAKFVRGESLDSIPKALLASGSPQMKAFNGAADLAKVTQARIDAENASRQAHGQGLIDEGPGSVMDKMRKDAVAAGDAVRAQLQAAGVSGKALLLILQEIDKTYKDIGAAAPKATESGLMKGVDKGVSYAHSAADAINLFGSSPRAQQEGSILNTGANAVDDFTHGNFAQGGLAIASLAKQIFGLGSQSHATKDAITAANNALKDTMSIEADILNHNPLQAMLDQVKQLYDQMYASINATLPGLKNQTQRNIDLAAATDMYNQKLALTKAQFDLQTSDLSLSMQARMDAAKGLTFDAAKLNLQISQANEMANIINTYGKDSVQAQTLATVQNTEMLRLVNQSLTQVSNAPTGFFAEGYASSFVTKQPWPTSGGTTSGAGAGTTVTGPVTINLPASADPVATARAVVNAIRKLGASTVGINGTVADAMELM